MTLTSYPSNGMALGCYKCAVSVVACSGGHRRALLQLMFAEQCFRCCKEPIIWSTAWRFQCSAVQPVAMHGGCELTYSWFKTRQNLSFQGLHMRACWYGQFSTQCALGSSICNTNWITIRKSNDTILTVKMMSWQVHKYAMSHKCRCCTLFFGSPGSSPHCPMFSCWQVWTMQCIGCLVSASHMTQARHPHPGLPSLALVKVREGMTGSHLRPANVKNAAAFNEPPDPHIHLQSPKTW